MRKQETKDKIQNLADELAQGVAIIPMKIMNKINLGSIQLPTSAATKTFAILAKRGAGKSYTGAVLAEEFYRNNIPFLVFDPIDVWWGLRLNKDGETPGLPVVVFGLLGNADITLHKDMGKQIAREIVEKNVSCVIRVNVQIPVGVKVINISSQL